MKDDDFIIEKVQVSAKTRKLHARWNMDAAMGDSLNEKELDELRQESINAFDKWAWDTGTDADKKKYQELEKELKFEEGKAQTQAEIDDIISGLAADIKESIDQDIINKLKTVVDIDDEV